MRKIRLLPLLLAACVAASAPVVPPSQPLGPSAGIISATYDPVTATTTVVFGVTWAAPTAQTGQAPVASYRTYVCHGPLGGVADTLVERTVPATQLQDSLTVVIATDTLSAITGVIRTVDTQGRISGIAGSAPISFNVFPQAPNPPNSPTVRQVSP